MPLLRLASAAVALIVVLAQSARAGQQPGCYDFAFEVYTIGSCGPSNELRQQHCEEEAENEMPDEFWEMECGVCAGPCLFGGTMYYCIGSDEPCDNS